MGKNPALYFNRTTEDAMKDSEASHKFSSTSSHDSNSARSKKSKKSSKAARRKDSESSCEANDIKDEDSVVFQDQSENSDHLPYYYNTQNYEKVGNKGQRVFESNQESDAKHKLRMKDFHRVLGQYNICILPEPHEKFQDGMPTFSIFTGDCSRKGKAVHPHDNHAMQDNDPLRPAVKNNSHFNTAMFNIKKNGNEILQEFVGLSIQKFKHKMPDLQYSESLKNQKG